MPGDYDIEYASPWAGANYQPYVLLRHNSISEYGRHHDMCSDDVNFNPRGHTLSTLTHA